MNQHKDNAMLKFKIFFKTFICSILYYTGLIHFYILLVFRKNREYPAVIINYHRFVKNLDNILETHPSVTHRIDDFKKEIRFLNKYFDIRSLDDIVDHINKGEPFTRPTIALTIDDGYKDNFDLMFPVLQEEQIPATVFLSTAAIGTFNMNWYDQFANVLTHTSSKSLQMNGLFDGEIIKLDSLEDKRAAYNCIIEKLKDIDIQQRNQCLSEIEMQLGSVENKQPLMLNWNDIRKMSESNITFGAFLVYCPGF